MPIQSCGKDGKPGYKFGENGACYPYIAGNEESRRSAFEKARAQGAAIKSIGGLNKTEEERAKSHFNISDEEWNKLSDHDKKAFIDKLPPRGTALEVFNFLSRERALEILKKPSVVDADPKEVILDNHRWVHMWESGIHRGNDSFLSKDQIRELHRILVEAMRNLGMDSGVKHDSPITFEALKLASPVVSLINNRKPLILDSEFISLVGSAVSNKELPSDYDLLIRANSKHEYDVNLAEMFPDLDLDFIYQPSGPNGPYIPLYSLIASPIESPGIKEPNYTIQPMSPIPQPTPGIIVNKNTVKGIFADSYYTVPIKGERLMVHRRENTVIAYDAEQNETQIPESIENDLLSIDDPTTFILDGFLITENNREMYLAFDMPWWRDSEHVSQSAETRKHFLRKLAKKHGISETHSKYFATREDAIEYLHDIDTPHYLIPGSSEYPIDGSSQWILFNPEKKLAQGTNSDDQIRELMDSGKWESLPAGERFNLMIKRRGIEPLYPYAQLKTTKKGYSDREVFGISHLRSLTKDLFKVPNKVSTETKFDGFRGQIHKKGDIVKIFTESGHEITSLLPNLVKDTKSLPVTDMVTDAELTPYDEKLQNLGRRAAAPAFAKGATVPVDDKLWAAHVFDLLYINGEDIHNNPYEERRTLLRGIELPIRDYPKKTSDFALRLWENDVNWSTTAEQMEKHAEQSSEVPGSEGAVFKQNDSKYRLSGTTPLWAKMKDSFEVDVVVVGTEKKGTTYNYVGAVGPVELPQGAKPESIPVNVKNHGAYVKWNGKIYAILGATFNSGIEANSGDIIRVNVKEINEIEKGIYTWFHAQVLEVREDKTQPDPLETAKTIHETSTNAIAHSTRPKRKLAFLTKSRFGLESSIACCDVPWITLMTDEGTAHLPNVDETLTHLRELEVSHIIGSKTTKELALNWFNRGISFELTDALTIRDYLGRTDLVDYEPNDNAEIDPTDLKAFYKSTPEDLAILLIDGKKQLLEKTVNLAQPYTTHPDENTAWKYVIQFHIRGLSVHADFRAQFEAEKLFGWTWDIGKSLIKPMLRRTNESTLTEAGLTKADLDLPIKELSVKLQSTKEGKKLQQTLSRKTQELSMAQLKTMCNELWDDEVVPILNDPNKKILTQKKGPMPSDWLSIEGEVAPGAVGATSDLEGQFIIMDSGIIELGTQKPYYHEYFLHGKRIDQRLLIRRLQARKEWELSSAFAWLAFFPKQNEIPYVLSKRAIERDYMPPQGVSALPKSVRSQIPRSYRYWEPQKNRTPKQVREELVNHLSRIKIKMSAGLEFAVKRVWHKGPVVRRGQAVVRYWLILHDGKQVLDAFNFGQESDPITEDGITATRIQTKDLSELIKPTGELSPNHSASTAKKIPTYFDTSDEGSISVDSDTNNTLLLTLNGSKLNGKYALVKNGQEWILKKITLPEKQMELLLSAADCTHSCPTTGILHLAASDVESTIIAEDLLILNGPGIKPGEVLPMDGQPCFFTKEGIKKFWPSMIRQPIVVMHGELKGDVVGFVNRIHYDDNTGWGWIDEGVIWHPVAIRLIQEGQLPAFSIEVIPEAIWDAEHQHNHVIGGRCVGISLVTKGACVTCTYEAKSRAKLGEVYKFGMLTEEFIKEQYWNQGLTTAQIGSDMDIGRTTIENWMERSGIPRRSKLEARRINLMNADSIAKFGGLPKISALGTGDHGAVGRSTESTLFTLGEKSVAINAPRGISMLAKPSVIVIGDETMIDGLSEFTEEKPALLATINTWETIRDLPIYKSLQSFVRKSVAPGQSVILGEGLTLMPTSDNQFKLQVGEKTIWHGEITEQLNDVDLCIGNASKPITPQIAFASNVSAIYLTRINEITDELKTLTEGPSNIQLLSDGATIKLSSPIPGASYNSSTVDQLLDGTRTMIVRTKPYSEFSKQSIYLLDDEKIRALYVEGLPEGPFPAEDVKKMVEEHKLSDEEWTELIGDADKVWIYRPRILRKLDDVEYDGTHIGPYVLDVKPIN